MQPAAPITDNSGRPIDIPEGVHFIPDAVSLGIALAVVFLAFLALRGLLVRVLRVPVRLANAISGIFLAFASYAVYSIMRAMSHP